MITGAGVVGALKARFPSAVDFVEVNGDEVHEPVIATCEPWKTDGSALPYTYSPVKIVSTKLSEIYPGSGILAGQSNYSRCVYFRVVDGVA